MTTNELINLFFSDLKRYNSSNFKTLEKADLAVDGDSPMVRKSFSSVITRYFIFREKHPEITDEENKNLDKISMLFKVNFRKPLLVTWWHSRLSCETT